MSDKERRDSWQRGLEVLKAILAAVLAFGLMGLCLFGLNGYVPHP